MVHEVLTLAEAAERLSVSRTQLRRMLSEAPRDLPGAPTPIGGGAHRVHVRWLLADLLAWFEAYGAWRRGETHRPARRPQQRTARRVVASV